MLPSSMQVLNWWRLRRINVFFNNISIKSGGIFDLRGNCIWKTDYCKKEKSRSYIKCTPGLSMTNVTAALSKENDLSLKNMENAVTNNLN